MKLSLSILLLLFALAFSAAKPPSYSSSTRRLLHQPLFSSPASPPPPDGGGGEGGYNPDQPFFPEVPDGGSGTRNQTSVAPSPPSETGPNPIPPPTQPAKPTKTVAIAVSVGLVTLGMMCGLSIYVYKHKMNRRGDDLKAERRNSHSYRYDDEETRAPASSFLYLGTVEHSGQLSVPTAERVLTPERPPHRKLDPMKKSDRYRPSPELQPLPPLSRPIENSRAISSSDEEEEEEERDREMSSFYTPHGSIAGSFEEGYSTPNSSTRRSSPYSKRTSSRSRRQSLSYDVVKHAIIPSIKTTTTTTTTRAKFGGPPPPPNLALLQSISNSSATIPPPPPPPPRVKSTWTDFIPRESEPTAKVVSRKEKAKIVDDDDDDHVDGGAKAKLKPLHWDKVRATSDRATVWDKLRPSSFQLNEDAMESLFGCSSNNSNTGLSNEAVRKSAPLPPAELENRVLDPKKSQNIAILLRALNVTRDEVSEALLDGNPDALGAELMETLAKMAPNKEEEIKLKEFKGDITKLGTAERFLKAILDIPFAFNRVEAMLYRANFDAELKYLRKSFQTLEEASGELRNSKLFYKLIEAVLTTGNRMNVGTNRGGAQSFKLDTLLKLVDIKGTDGKTTLLHFVVQEIIRSEGTGSAITTMAHGSAKGKDEEFRKQGLQVVSGLSREIGHVKLAAGMDSDVLHNYVAKLETGLEKVRKVLQYESLDTRGNFFNSMKAFVGEAEVEIERIKDDERKALDLVREVTEYFHGNAAKEEARPLRIFTVVRDFLSTLDHVCKDVGTMQERPVMGSARSFRISSNAPLPVLNRYNPRYDETSSEDSSST